MGIEIPQNRLQVRQIQTRVRKIPVDQIINVLGYNPMASGIDEARKVIGEALTKRAELRKQGAQLAKLETISGLPGGSFSGLDSNVAAGLTGSYVKNNFDLNEKARELSDKKIKIRSLESSLGYVPGELGDDYESAKIKVQSDLSEKRMNQSNENILQRQQQAMENQQKLADERTRQKSVRDADVAAQAGAKALLAIGKIRTASDDLPQFGSGVTNQAFGKAAMGIKSFAKEEKTATYEGYVSQELIPLARNLAEEKGPITDNDVARIEKGLGDKTTPKEIRNSLLNELVNKIELSVASKAESAGIPIEEIYAKNKTLYELLKKEKAYSLKSLTSPVSGNKTKIGRFNVTVH